VSEVCHAYDAEMLPCVVRVPVVVGRDASELPNDDVLQRQVVTGECAYCG
jgi:hypothetical protein